MTARIKDGMDKFEIKTDHEEEPEPGGSTQAE